MVLVAVFYIPGSDETLPHQYTAAGAFHDQINSNPH